MHFRAGLPGFVWDEYEESVPMSTYLLAFVVVDFEHRSSGRFSVWTRADAINSASYALEIGPKVLNFYEKYFNISYPLPKVDMISLPDFTAGGAYLVQLIIYFMYIQVAIIIKIHFINNFYSYGKFRFNNIS